jgi:hypothetical protein
MIREPGAWGYNRATLFLGDIRKYGDLTLQVLGNLESETAK